MAGTVLLTLFAVVAGTVTFVLYDPEIANPAWLGAILPLTCAGLAMVGTISTAVTSGPGPRSSLAPLLVVPVSVPLLLAAAQATEGLRAGAGILRWLLLLCVVDVVLALAGSTHRPPAGGIMSKPLDVAAGLMLATALVLGLVVPPDAVQGDLQRMMAACTCHLHGSAYLSFATTLVAGIAYLRTRRMRWDHIAGASGEVGWSSPASHWSPEASGASRYGGVVGRGTPASCLPRQMFFVYLGYLALRRSFDDPEVGWAQARSTASSPLPRSRCCPLLPWFGGGTPSAADGASPQGLPDRRPATGSAPCCRLCLFTVVFAAPVLRRLEINRLEDLIAGPSADEMVAGSGVAVPLIVGGGR